MFQVIPQRTNIKPKYITIDNAGLINLTIKQNTIEYLSNIDLYKSSLWSDNFRTNKKEFKRKNYAFNYMIKTDGIGCSIILIKLKDGNPINITSNMQKTVSNKKMEIDKYIEEIKITDEMKKKRIITIDPGTSDLIYCLSKTIPYKKLLEIRKEK